MARRSTLVCLLAAAVAFLAVAQVAFLSVVSRPDFRAWLKAQLDQSGQGVFSFGRVGGNPLWINLREVAFESRGPGNIKRIYTPVAYAVLDWPPLLRERRIVLRSVRLVGAQVEVQLEGGRPEQIALPLPAGRVELQGSVVRITKLSGWTAFLTGVNASLTQPDPGAPRGLSASFESERVLLGPLAIQNARGSLLVGNGTLDLLGVEAALHGGSLKASGSMLLDPPQLLRRVDLALKGIDVLPALRGLRYSDRFEGRVELETSFTGRLDPAVRTLAGHGRLGLQRFGARADLPKVNLFNIAPVLNQLKRVENLAGSAQFQLDGQRVELAGFFLQKRDLKITGSGYLTLGGGLSADCRAFLRGEFAQGVPSVVRSSLVRSDTGELIVPFKVANTLAEPKVDIGRVVSGALRHVFVN
jgi:hypothetical protein